MEEPAFSKESRGLREVARVLNLSEGTVSRALRGRGDIAQVTRDRVAQVAAELNYVPRQRTARKTPLERIAVLMGNLCLGPDGVLDPTFVGIHVLAQIERIASSAGVGVMAGFIDSMAPGQGVDRLPMLYPGQAQAVILVYPFPESTVRQLAARLPVVSIEHVYPSASIDTVGPTHAVDAMCAVEHLHRLGHRRIGYVCDEEARGHKLTTGLRYAGYVSGLTRCELPYRPADVINLLPPYVEKPELPAAVARMRREGVTAVITSIDRHGYLLWETLPGQGIRVPEDLSLVCIGGVYRDAGLPQLTTWRCNYEAIACSAFDALKSRHAGMRSTQLYQEVASVFIQGKSSANAPVAG